MVWHKCRTLYRFALERLEVLAVCWPPLWPTWDNQSKQAVPNVAASSVDAGGKTRELRGVAVLSDVCVRLLFDMNGLCLHVCVCARAWC